MCYGSSVCRILSCNPTFRCRCSQDCLWESNADRAAGPRARLSYGFGVSWDPSTGALCGGSVTRKTVDSPGCESHESCPPCDSMIERLMGSPRPNPPDFVV